MNRSQLVDKIAEKAELTKKDADKFLFSYPDIYTSIASSPSKVYVHMFPSPSAHVYVALVVDIKNINNDILIIKINTNAIIFFLTIVLPLFSILLYLAFYILIILLYI